MQAMFELDLHGAGGERSLAHCLDLPAKLGGVPEVVVVAEGDEVGVEGQDAGVAGTGQAGPAPVGHDHHGGLGGDGQAPVGFGPVIDDDEAQEAGVVLLAHGGDGAGEHLGAAVGGDHDADARPHHRTRHRISL
jgi:hypothetical protein